VTDVRVKYSPNAKRKFTFLPWAFTMWEPGKVKLTRHPGSAQWTFLKVTFKDDPTGQFDYEVVDGGESLEIEDKFHNEDPELYMYNVTILLDGEEITSPDPVIVNDPGSREFETSE
jgi:hypothetical protein